MTPTETLKHEHQVILRVLEAAENEVASIEKNGTIHASLLREMADFFRGFVDHCHHAKEERHLFDLMYQRGMSMRSRPLAVMLHDHEQGRACIRAIWEALPEEGEPDAAATGRIRENLSAYTSLLRSHIDREDHVLYPMEDSIGDGDQLKAEQRKESRL
ncbi:MAG: hemerythrin domain-containing protein [Phycisphaerae bacterium]|nr:hemerythrin domain-containing protein [Phycisphaerae bacterium]